MDTIERLTVYWNTAIEGIGVLIGDLDVVFGKSDTANSQAFGFEPE